MAEKKNNGNNDFLKEIKEVYDFMIENNLEAVELTRDNEHIKLVRKSAQTQNVQLISAPASQISAQPSNTAVQPQTATQTNAPSIKAPMSGIFYRAQSPSSPPYVREGDVVEPGTVVCLIEAMKVFNEIKADFKCKIVKSVAENGKFVNEGDILFIVEKL